MTTLNTAPHDSSTEAPREANDYRFEHLNLGLLLQDMRFSRTALAPGDQLLDTTLLNLDGQEVSLRSLAAGGPIALVTGSTTCPATASSMPDLNRLEERCTVCSAPSPTHFTSSVRTVRSSIAHSLQEMPAWRRRSQPLRPGSN